MFYKNLQVHGLPFDCHLKSSGTIQVKVLNKPDGWTVHTSDFQVPVQFKEQKLVRVELF